MANFTKLFCDLISVGANLRETTVPVDQIVSAIEGIALYHQLGLLDLQAVKNHIEDVRVAQSGADNDIDDVRLRLAQGRPVSISRIVEFHGKLTVKLNDGTELPFDAKEVSHY